MEEFLALRLRALLERLREEGVAKVMLRSDWRGNRAVAWGGGKNKTERLPLGAEDLLAAAFLEVFATLTRKEWSEYALLDLEENRLHLKGRACGGKDRGQTLRFAFGDLLRATPFPREAEGFLPPFDLWEEGWVKGEGLYERASRGLLASDAWRGKKKEAMGLVPHLLGGVRQKVKREGRPWFWTRVRKTQGVEVDFVVCPLVEEVFPLDQVLEFILKDEFFGEMG